MSIGKPTSSTSTQKAEVIEKASWNSLGKNNLKYIINEKGILLMSVNLNKVYKPSKSFWDTNPKKSKTNILVSSTGGNISLLDKKFEDFKISVNVYRPMKPKEIEEWKKKN